MAKENNLIFLNEYNPKEITTLVREGIKGKIKAITIDNNDEFFALSISQLHDIHSYHPQKRQIYFRQPVSRNYQIEDFGSWKYVNLDNLLVDKLVANALLNKHDKKPNIQTITAKDRKKRWQETADQIIQKNPTWDKNSVAEEIVSLLTKEDPAFIKKEDSAIYPVETVKRNFNMKKSRRR